LLYIEGKRAVNDLRFIKKLIIMMCLRDIGRFMVNAYPEDDCNPFRSAGQTITDARWIGGKNQIEL
jgi:hypothetical protein